MQVTAESWDAMSDSEKLALVQSLATRKPAKVGFKVSEKGALSMYGLGRFPVTLYRSQWNTVLSQSEAIKDALTWPGLVDKT